MGPGADHAGVVLRELIEFLYGARQLVDFLALTVRGVRHTTDDRRHLIDGETYIADFLPRAIRTFGAFLHAFYR